MNKTNFATHNILHKLLDKPNRILYNKTNSLFDKALQSLDIEIYSDTDSNFTDHFYDAYVSNNFLQHSMSRSKIEPYHLHDILFIHEALNDLFKKEDRTILNNNLKPSTKIIFHSSLINSWKFLDNKVYNINYGIPDISIDLYKERKDILVINLKQNSQYANMYQYLKNLFPATTMLTDVKNYDWEQIYTLISEYKVVIDESSIYNQLIAASCGCIIITPHIHFDKKIIGYFNIDNFNTISDQMKSIIMSYDINNFIEQIDHIKTTYPLEVFGSRLMDIIQTVKQDIFIL